jgi:hypothetical protein
MVDLIGDKVTISGKRFRELLACEDKLLRLEAGGVDNWHGYGWAMRHDEDCDCPVCEEDREDEV